MGTTATILGALIGAGGQIGGGLLSQEGQEDGRAELAKIRGSGLLVTNPVALQDPILAAVYAQALGQLGIVQPSLIENARPINQVVNQARASGRFSVSMLGARTRPFEEAIALIESGVSFDDPRIARLTSRNQGGWILLEGGFEAGPEGLRKLLEADREYLDQVGPIVQNLEAIRSAGLERTGLVNEALLSLTQQAAAGSDFDALREAERVRLQREIEDRRRSALSTANFGGFNPGRALEDISELETDADLVATERATSLALGEQGVLSNALALLNALNPANIAPPTAGVPTPGQAVLTGASGGGSGAAGAGVSGGATTIGNTISSLGLLSLLNQNPSNPPAFGGAQEASHAGQFGLF